MTSEFHTLIPTLEADGLAAMASAGPAPATEGDENDPFYYPMDLTIFAPGAASALESMQSTAAFESYQGYLSDFTDFLADLNLRFFTAKEFLFLGGGHHGAGACHGLNRLPPRSLWPQVRTLAPVVDEIRHRLGASVTFNSVYRNTRYNSCIGGVGNSIHKSFKAADFRCTDGKGSGHWAKVAKDLRSEGFFRGGIGIYNSFVHVDTRGSNVDWDNRT